jgi:hypothetical protein
MSQVESALARGEDRLDSLFPVPPHIGRCPAEPVVNPLWINRQRT